MNRSIVLLFIGMAAACSVNAKVGAGAKVSGDGSEQTEPEPAPAAAASAAPAPSATQPTGPVPDACPLTCYVAAGAEHQNVSDAELQQLQAALAPTLNAMRACATPDTWRRHGSPILNLRIAPDGKIAEVGVDPHHYHDNETCVQSAAQGANPNAAFPGRTTIRCAERCQTPRATATGKRKR